MNKHSAIILIFAATMLMTSLVIMPAQVSAVWWNPVGWACNQADDEIRYDAGILGPSTPQGCQDGDRACDASGNFMCYCGDYDLDWCTEYPNTLNDCEYCAYGCYTRTSGAACYNADPCDGGSACIEGQTTCGAINPLGNPDHMDIVVDIFGPIEPQRIQTGPVDAVIRCGEEEPFGCFAWQEDEIVDVCWEANSFCSRSAGGAKCVRRGDFQKSGCTGATDKECSGANEYVLCKDLDGDHIWQFDYLDPRPCQYGCKDGVCLTEDGDEGCPCIENRNYRCHPDQSHYIQTCVEDSAGCGKWKPFDDKYDTHCDFGCDKGSCIPDPTTAKILEEGDDCVVGEKICVHGTSELECVLNDAGNPEYLDMHTCPSGVCRGGKCMNSTSFGLRFAIDFVAFTGDQPAECDLIEANGLAFDGQYYWITYTSINDTQFSAGAACNTEPYKVALFDREANLFKRSNISAERGGSGPFKSIAFDGFDMWVMNNTDVFKLQGNGVALHQWAIPHDYNDPDDINGPFFMTVDDTYVYIGWHNNATYKYYKETGIEDGYICMAATENVAGVPTVSTTCRDHNTGTIYDEFRHTYITYERETDLIWQLYVDEQPSFKVSGLMVEFIGSYRDYALQQYGTDGEYRGLYPIESGLYAGMAMHESRLYMLEVGVNDDNNHDAVYINVYNLFDTCRNNCFNGSQKCVGTFNTKYVDCVQGNNGCWDWYDYGLFPELDGSLYTHDCPLGNCEEYWVNHRTVRARCSDKALCEDACIENQTECSDDKRHVKVCAERAAGAGFVNPASPLLSIPILDTCFTYGLQGDWIPCAQNQICIDGTCVGENECESGESICIGEGVTSYVVQCNQIAGTDLWAFDNTNRTPCRFRCNQTSLDVNSNLPCNDSSTLCKRFAECDDRGADFHSNLKESGVEAEVFLETMFSNPVTQILFFVILIIITAGVTGFISGSWELGGVAGTGWLMVGAIAGWLPTEIMVIFAVVTAFMIYRMVTGNE